MPGGSKCLAVPVGQVGIRYKFSAGRLPLGVFGHRPVDQRTATRNVLKGWGGRGEGAKYISCSGLGIQLSRDTVTIAARRRGWGVGAGDVELVSWASNLFKPCLACTVPSVGLQLLRFFLDRAKPSEQD